jgi:chromosome partitioning protein
LAGGEDEVLESCTLESTVMRSRRRRNKAPSPESQERGSAVDTEVVGSGNVRLVASASVDATTEGDVPDDNPQPEHEGSSTGRSAAVVDAPAVSEPAAEGADRGQVWDRTQTEEIPLVGAPVHARSLPNEVESLTAEAPATVATAVDPAEDTAGPATRGPEEDDLMSEVAVTAPEDGPAAQAASGNALPRVIAVANQKGGVGKTTTSVNLGAALAELGFRVLVVDLDPQGNATTGLGIDARHFEQSMYDVLMRDTSLEDCVEPTALKNLFVAPATIALAGAEIELVPAFSRELKLRRAIESVIDDFDFILIDCPPSLGLITVNALAAAGEVLVPIQCEYYALEGLSQLTRNVHLVASNLNPKLDISTIVLTMYDARTKLADEVASDVRTHFGTKVCRIVIPRTVRLSEAPSFGQPITAFDPSSRGAVAYRELAKEVSGGTS